jgi:hypothetical protein
MEKQHCASALSLVVTWYFWCDRLDATSMSKMAIVNPLGHVPWINLPSLREDESAKLPTLSGRVKLAWRAGRA